MDDVIKHKGPTKGNDGLTVSDYCGDQKFRGNERSDNEELKESKIDVRYLTGGNRTQIHRQGYCIIGYIFTRLRHPREDKFGL